jgi:hypothetical protein
MLRLATKTQTKQEQKHSTMALTLEKGCEGGGDGRLESVGIGSCMDVLQ